MGRKMPLLDITGKDMADGIRSIAEALGAKSRISFKRLQEIIRAGRIDEYMAIGDEIEVEREKSVSVSSSNVSLTVTISEDTWDEHVEYLYHGTYEFVYDGYEWSERELGAGLDMAYYGISITGTPAADDVILVTVTTDTLVFVYVAKDKVTPVNPNLVHSAAFQMKDCIGSWQFDASEAIIYADAAMPAGTYHFNLYKPSNIYYLNSGLQNKDVQFTTTVDIPAGGQLVLSTGSFKDSTQVSGLKLTSYGSRGSITALESNIACSEGTSGTDLGDANKASNSTKINSTDRCVYGSNRWAESALRARLNSNKAANAWWAAQGRFDRRPSGYDSAAFMHGIEKDFLNVLQPIKNTTVENWFDGGASHVTNDLFFVPSNSQVWFTSSDTEGEPWDFYTMFSDNVSAGTGADSNRIKRVSGSATYWWTRTPDSDYSDYEFVVVPGGSWSDSYANYASGVAPACVIA